MALIKYYNLESHSEGDVSDLERNLQKYLLSEKHVNGLLETDVKDVVQAKEGNGDKDTLTKLLYDSGDFDVLYKTSWTISKGKKRWFGENSVPRFGTELVVRATPEDILELQDYLAGSGFEVVEARGISRATFNFATTPAQSGHVACYTEMLGNLIQRDYPGVKGDIRKNNGVKWGEDVGTTCVGMYEGAVIDILKLQKQIISSAETYGCPVKNKSINFL
ncbi:MAG: hypothetical protein AABW48_02790 [Nanoarchaeota archaeon]